MRLSQREPLPNHGCDWGMDQGGRGEGGTSRLPKVSSSMVKSSPMSSQSPCRESTALTAVSSSRAGAPRHARGCSPLLAKDAPRTASTTPASGISPRPAAAGRQTAAAGPGEHIRIQYTHARCQQAQRCSAYALAGPGVPRSTANRHFTSSRNAPQGNDRG